MKRIFILWLATIALMSTNSLIIFPVSAQTGAWRMTPLVTSATPISDLPGKHIVEFGQIYVRPAGELVFWGRLANREEKWSWSLFSYREGTVRTILEGGESVACKYSTDPAARFLVRPSNYWSGSGTSLANGKLLFITRITRKEYSAYAWDGEKLRPVLRAGDRLEIAGRGYTLSYAGVPAASATTGAALIQFIAKEPAKLNGWALGDGEHVWPLPADVLQLPGAKLRFDMKSPLDRALVPGPFLLAMVSGRGAAGGLYALGPAEARLLVGKGADYPFAAGRKIRDVILLFAQSTTRFVTLLEADNLSTRYAYHDGGKILDLTPPEALGRKGWGFTLQQGDFLTGDAPWFLYKGDVTKIGGSGLNYAQGTQVYLFDGTAVRRLTDSRVIGVADWTRIERILGGDFPGALVRANLSGTGPKGKLPDQWPLWFLDLHDPAAGLKPVPEIELEGGRRVSLEAVVATPAPGVAIAILTDGLYRLEKIAAVAP